MLFRYHTRKSLEKVLQKASALKDVEPHDRTVHIICVRKMDYLKAGARCANSIWFHNPEVKIKFHIDEILSLHDSYLKRKLNRLDRATIVVENNFRNWQELKLRVILSELQENDYFCDADIYWNAPLPIEDESYYFASEPAQLCREPYYSALRAAGLHVGQNSFMANSSFIKFGKGLDRAVFANEVNGYFNSIQSAYLHGKVEKSVAKKIIRLSEQIALSVAINSRSEVFRALKKSDSPMDRGIAESYYLGTTKGWD
jgi:hypothetical protein